MARRRNHVTVVLVVAMMLAAVPGFVPLPVAAQPPQRGGAGGAKVIVDNGDTGAIRLLTEGGATRIEDYGAFSLWRVGRAGRASFAAASAGIAPADEFDTIQFRNGTVDTDAPVPPAPAGLRQSKGAGEQFWLVQFVGPIKPDWLDGLRKDGLEIVSYLPNNAYVVWGVGGAVDTLERSVAAGGVRQFSGAYHPAYRLAPSLQGDKTPLPERVDVTVQFYLHTGVDASIGAVSALSGGVLIMARQDLGNLADITLSVPSSALPAIASRADVFNVEPFTPPKKNDEVQGQILAGNLATSGGNVVPSGPGYLAWLTTKGFPTTPTSYPVVFVVDDGVDDGDTTPLHRDFHELALVGNPSRVVATSNCTTDALPNGIGGHGNINASIVAGYNNDTGTANEDANGYNYGLGISPYGHVANQKIFTNAGGYNISHCGGNDAGVVQEAVNAGAQIGSNSWGAPVNGAYNASSRSYDILTRDANGTTAGNQQMLHVFSAGNDGPNPTTLGSPGTAKNVLTVGATENVRDDGVADGCMYSGANNADDTATFSSRGPTTDGRAKPDITAPGTHVQGAASQAAGYNGSSVCNAYYPAVQTLYAWSSGTSHSAPAVSGAASLLWNYYGRVLAPGQTPSPAMLKALLLNTPRYLNGAGTGGTLPQTAQGWGDVNLGTLFDSSISRVLKDQNNLFTATGQSQTYTGTVASNAKPFRVSLVFTDAPGPTTGNAYVNNLDLTVTIGGQTYKGNVFSGANSTTGGAADARNNVENVFLPVGVSGNFSVKVTASNLAALAVPGGAGTVNQDYAVVISNGTEVASLPVLAAGTATFSDTVGGNGNSVMEPGEQIAFSLPVSNEGTATATSVAYTVTATGPNASLVTITNGTKMLGNINAGASAVPSTAVLVTLSPSFPCGAVVMLTTQIMGVTGTSTVSYTTGVAMLGTATTFTATGLPLAIPDNTPAGVNKPLAVSGLPGTVGKVTTQISITHIFDNDLNLRLTAPNGTSIALVSRRGDSGDNFTNTVLDDNAATAIGSGAAPFTGTFRPEQPLSGLNGSAVNDTWTLNIADLAATDTGSLTAWSLTITLTTQVCSYVLQGALILGIGPTSGGVGGGTPVTLTGFNFTSAMTVKFGTATATVLNVSPDGTQAIVTVPPAAVGFVDVSVQAGVGPTRVLPQAYTYGIITAAPAPTRLAMPGMPPAGPPPPRASAPIPAAGTPTPLPAPMRR